MYHVYTICLSLFYLSECTYISKQLSSDHISGLKTRTTWMKRHFRITIKKIPRSFLTFPYFPSRSLKTSTSIKFLCRACNDLH